VGVCTLQSDQQADQQGHAEPVEGVDYVKFAGHLLEPEYSLVVSFFRSAV
jgi:hypothetical protein